MLMVPASGDRCGKGFPKCTSWACGQPSLAGRSSGTRQVSQCGWDHHRAVQDDRENIRHCTQSCTSANAACMRVQGVSASEPRASKTVLILFPWTFQNLGGLGVSQGHALDVLAASLDGSMTGSFALFEQRAQPCRACLQSIDPRNTMFQCTSRSGSRCTAQDSWQDDQVWPQSSRASSAQHAAPSRFTLLFYKPR